MEARDALVGFLQDLNTEVVHMENTVEELVESNFDTLDDKNMRLLIDRALKERDLNLAKGGKEADLLGSWGVVIDCIKSVTLKRRDRAGHLLQMMVNTGYKSGPKEMQALLSTLKAQNQIDRVFVDLVSTSLEDCQSQGNAVLTDILKYAKTFLAVMKSKEKMARGAISPSPSNKPSPAAPVITKPTAAGSAGGDGSPQVAVSTEKASSAVGSTAPVTTAVTEPVAPPGPAEPVSGIKSETAVVDAETENKMIKAGLLLQEILRNSAGDASVLKSVVIEHCLRGEIDSLFAQVLEDNIKGCREANYVNKLKILEFMKGVIGSQIELQSRQGSDTYDYNVKGDRENLSGMITSTHHAPQFVDEGTLNPNAPYGRGSKRHFAELGHIEVTMLPDCEFINAREASAAMRGAPVPSAAASGASTATTTTTVNPNKVNNKKKSSKSSAKKTIAKMAEAASKHLEEHGWAVLDNFLPLDVVQRIRVESGIFRNSFETSEIWVGKQADVGAQIAVPSVRGDKVLWMCGGHSSAAPEGVSRTVRTIGEIEPCKLEVKKQAPIRKFAAMKELVGSCDALVEAMKGHCPSMAGVYERSDAMLAIYPGEGSRFAKHIDNSTGDGRRVTIVVYLNPGWKKEDGGALRVFPQSQYRSAGAKAAAAAAGAEAIDLPPAGSLEAVDVYPECGRLAIFYSADVAHEVLPTFADRHAITIWYYDQTERDEAVKKAKEEGTARRVATASTESQQLAKVFIGDLMGGDDVSEDGGEPTEDELRSLAVKVAQFSDEVIGVVAAITGAPSVQSFRTGFPLLSTQDLKSMRALFRRMGLGSYSVA